VDINKMANYLLHAFVVGIFIYVWSIGFRICRMCSIYFDNAKCKKFLIVRNPKLRRILISSTYVNLNRKLIVQTKEEKEKISMLGVVAHVVINFCGVKLVYIVIQREFFYTKQISDVKQALSAFFIVMALAVYLELVNNWRV